jgi:single-strand DNA-binding protein
MMLIGNTRIGNDPQVRYTPDGSAVLELSLAYNHGKKQDDGKRPTQWVNAALWGSRAEKMAPYLTKGTQVFVSASDVHVSAYEQKDGTKRYSLRCRIDVIEFVSGSKSEPENKPTQHEKAKANAYQPDPFGDLDDDIPL